jgi:hypothetical protein
MLMKRIVVVASLGLVLLAAREAGAQTMSFGTFHGYFTGHIGGVLGGDVDDPRITGGASVSVQERTGWGAEFDFGRATGVEIEAHEFSLTTYMFNMTFVQPSSMIRPFAAVGGGVYQVDGCVCPQSERTFDLGLSAGAGVFVLANDAIGMRADARYFWSAGDHRDLGRPDNMSHWRLSVGFTYLWTMAP